MGMNELHVTLGDHSYSFGAGETVRIGRSPDNDIVVSDPTVSRQHAQLSSGPSGWEFENVGRALSFLNGEPVTRALLSGPAQIRLSSVGGPVLSITPGEPPRQYEPSRYGASQPEPTQQERLQYAPPQYEPPQYGQPQYEPPQYEPPQYEPPQYAPPQYEPSQYGQPQYETPQYGQPSYERAQLEQAPYEQAQFEQVPYEPPQYELPVPGSSLADVPPASLPGLPEDSGSAHSEDPPDYAARREHAAEPGEPDQADRTSVLQGPVLPGGGAYPDDPAYPGAHASPSGGAHASPGGGAHASPGGGAADLNGRNGLNGRNDPGYPGGAGGPEAAGYPGRAAPRIRPVQSPQPVDEIATALHILVPIRSWLHDPGWRQFLRLLVIPYGLLPLIFIALFASSSNLSTPGWAYSLYIAPLWAIVFWLLIRPGQVERREVLIGIGAIFFALIWIRVITVHINGLMGHPGRPLPFFGAIGVGINEEITKALPILLAALLLLKYRSVKLDVRMWMFLGTIVGLAFGVTEQAGYTLQDIQGITSARANSQAIVEVLAFSERVFVDGFQHAMWAGVSAFFIGIAVNYPRRRIQLIAFGIAVPAVLHGLYDWSAGAFASLWIPIIIQAVSLFLFLGYTMSAAAIERQVRRTPMFRGESMLMERITDGDPPHGAAQPSRREAAPLPAEWLESARDVPPPSADWREPSREAAPSADWRESSPDAAPPPADWREPSREAAPSPADWPPSAQDPAEQRSDWPQPAQDQSPPAEDWERPRQEWELPPSAGERR
jgi:RsiW-degrading membrane proteinase PrsW (M82 family)